MPTAVVAYAIAEAVGATVATAVWVLAPAIGTAAFAAISAGTAFLVNAALQGGGSRPAQMPSVAQTVNERMNLLRSPVAPRETIYGEAFKSGVLVHAYREVDAANNYEYLYMFVAFADGECILSDFYLNDESLGELTAGVPANTKFSPYVLITTYQGTQTQTAYTPNIVTADGGGSTWTPDHRLLGICYAVIQLRYNRDTFPTGIPNIRAKVTRNPIYDIRFGSVIGPSSNPALAVYDWLVNKMLVPTSMIDTASFIAAANTCDEFVQLKTGGLERRYTCNGSIKSDVSHRTAIQQILSSCGGAITCPQGQYRLHVAAYTAPVIQFNEDVLRGPIKVRASVSKKDLFNAVRGQFVDPNRYYQAADFTPVVNANYATDDGEQIFTELQLPFTTSNPTAQRLARIMLEKSRQGITLEMPCNLKALQVLPMDNVLLNISHLGWNFDYTIDEMVENIDSWGYVDDTGGKVFKVIRTTLSPDGGVDLLLQEEASACYEWSESETDYDLAPNTTLPDMLSMAQPGNVQMVEELYETTGSAGVKSKATVSWTAPASGFVVDYELEYKLSSASAWKEIFNIRGTQYDFTDIAPGVYDFRVKARNIMNVTSAYTDSKRFTVYGLTAAPGNITGFSVTPMNSLALATWDLTTDLDVKIGGNVIIVYSALTTGATFADGVEVAKKNGDATEALLPLATGTYLAKFRDSTGHYSDTEASFAVTEALNFAWSNVATSTQHSAFSGTKTQCQVSGSYLIMSATYSTATYSFSATMDMTTATTRRYHGHIKARGYLADALLDSTEDFDSTEQFDDSAAINDCNAWLEVRVTNDDPAGSPTWSSWQKFMVADLYGRAAQFRLQMTRASLSNNIEIQELSVTTKIPA